MRKSLRPPEWGEVLRGLLPTLAMIVTFNLVPESQRALRLGLAGAVGFAVAFGLRLIRRAIHQSRKPENDG